MAAYDCCSTQLLKFCEMFEIKNEKKKFYNSVFSVVKKFKKFNKRKK
jgi:hypothetical protein